MFRALCRSSSGTSTVFAASGLHTLVETARGAIWVGTGLGIGLYLSLFPLRQHHGRSPQTYVNQKLQIQLRFLMMSDITLETCWTINVLWNNKIPLLSRILLVIATSQAMSVVVNLLKLCCVEVCLCWSTYENTTRKFVLMGIEEIWCVSKRAAWSLFYFPWNAVCFIILSFYLQIMCFS